MSSEYRSFLALSYDELEQLNLQAKADRLNRVAPDKIREDRLKYLTDEKERYLPDNIYDAIADFRSAEWITTILGDDVKGRFADLKQASADRCQSLLGTFVKGPEVQYHHEVYNQALWNLF